MEALRLGGADLSGSRQPWCLGVDELRNCRHDLGGCKRLLDQNTVGDPIGRPFLPTIACHVDDWHLRINFPCVPSHIPAQKSRAAKLYVCHHRPIVRSFLIKELDGVFCTAGLFDRKAAILERFFD